MSVDSELVKFYQDVNQEVYNKSGAEGFENTRVNTFTEIYIDYLTEAGVIEGGSVFDCYHIRPGTKGYQANGFNISDDESELVLFVSAFRNPKEIFTVAPSDVNKIVENAETFFRKSLEGIYTRLEEAKDEYDVAKLIYDIKEKIESVKIVFFTNGTVRTMPLNNKNEEKFTVSYQVWDLERVFRVVTSGNAREKIEINLEELAGRTLRCIKTKVPVVTKYDRQKEYKSGGYTSYLTVIPGDVLFKIYQAYNSRLLEKNVRTFLQVRGNVNKGIRDTIVKEPGMFLAYNNGISATAESVTVIDDDGVNCQLVAIKDFQIVNGGQTTASIYNSCKIHQKYLENVYVQAKITVIDDVENMEVMVPNISKYANTQNKIQTADFSANDVFHQEIEKLSRGTWAPAKTGGEKQTKWFYERSRGQYNDQKGRARSETAFENEYPKNQYFDKLLLARVENIWEGYPYIASKGGQNSFAEFTLRLGKRGKFSPDDEYYKKLIGKLIMYREIRTLVREQGFLGFWANVVDYTIAYLVCKGGSKIDLLKMWQDQDIPEYIRECIPNLSARVYRYINESAAGQNVTQWCKKQDCWNGLKALDIDIEGFDQLVPVSATPVNDEGKEAISKIKNVDVATWQAVIDWIKETKAFEGYVNITIKTIISLANNNFNREPTAKQAITALEALEKAIEKGIVNVID